MNCCNTVSISREDIIDKLMLMYRFKARSCLRHHYSMARELWTPTGGLGHGSLADTVFPAKCRPMPLQALLTGGALKEPWG